MHTKIIHSLPKLTNSSKGLSGRVLWLLCCLLGLLLGSLLVASSAQASQSYLTTDKTIVKGMAVAVANGQLNSQTADQSAVYVSKSSVSRASQTLGVVVDLSNDLVNTVNSQSHLYVANSGNADVYVTDINGSIRKGDLLAPSPLEGILMRAQTGAPGILGVALQNMPAQGNQTVKVDNQSITSAKVALLGINMDVKFASNSPTNQSNWLERIGQSIVKHQVSALQTFIALAVLMLLIVVEGSIIYAATNSSILSLGRNPLAKQAIMRSLIQTAGLVLVVLVIGLMSIYMVLRV